MATKSDFAQKLIHDLRVRKERMATAQNSSRQPTQTSRVVHGNTGQTSRGPRQINTLESAGPRTGHTSRRSNTGNNRSINTKESSNQIVLYGNGQSSRQQVQDLSMAITFAFENNGDLTNIRASSTNPLVNFFKRFGRKSRDTHKMDITSFGNRSQFPTVSNIHIIEVSKGVQKLNQILRACSNGSSFQSSSIEVGKELLKGAVDLEESLRMLVNLQEASQYVNTTQKKSRLKLLEEDEDEQDDNAKTAEQWKLDRPKFSFDKPSRNSCVVQNATRKEDVGLSMQVISHKRSTSYVQDLSLSTQVKQNNNYSSSSQSTQEKRRISNVVAKLMGLEEIPQNEDFILKKNDSKGKQVQVSKQGNTVAANQINGHQIFEDSKRKQKPTADKQSKSIESERKMQILNTELPQKVQNSKTHKAEDKIQNRIGYKSGVKSIETRTADKELPSNHQRHEEKRVIFQEQVLKRGEHSKDKNQKEKNGQHLQKQNLMAKNHEGHQVESVIPSKSKKSTPTNLQTKLSRDKPEPGNKRSINATQKVSIKDPPKRIHQDDAPMIDISQQTAHNKDNNKKEGQIHNSSTREPQLELEKESRNSVLTKENPTEVSAKQKTEIPRKVQRSEIPQKIDVFMSRRNANTNHLTRSIKQPANLLKDMKQQMHNKNRISKRMEEQSDTKVKDEKAGISIYNASEEMDIEPVKQQDKLQNEDDQSIILSTSVADECQIQDIQNTRTLNDSCEAIALNPGEVSDDLQTAEQSYALKDEQELKRCDQSIGDHEEESTELYNLSQHKNKQIQASERQEQLTEPEKHLKEIVIKSQMFLSTAEALFKLNIPISFLHAAEQDYEVAEKNKLVLNCAYEVMKRKARRHENAYNPYTKTTITCTKIRSLDDLIKQLCKDLESLKFYGGNVSDECDVAARLYKMLDKDIYHNDADVNSMWDFEWSNIMSLIHDKEDIVRDVERYMLNGLLNEITNDPFLLTVSV